MSFIDSVFIPYLYKKKGEDQFENCYYESKRKDYLEHRKRRVVYKGDRESSKIPPMWHAWLHHMIDEVPSDWKHDFVWQRDYLPNDARMSEPRDHQRGKTKYNVWQPNN